MQVLLVQVVKQILELSLSYVVVHSGFWFIFW